MPTVVASGADVPAKDGPPGPDAAEALKAEAQRRIEAGTFFGHIAYTSLLGTRPTS